MSPSEIILTRAARDILRAALPTANIRAEADTEPREKPEFVCATTGAEYLHPRLVRILFTLSLITAADLTPAATAAADHYAACEALASRILTLRSDLAAHGLQLLRFIPAELADSDEPDRQRRLSQSWTVHLAS